MESIRHDSVTQWIARQGGVAPNWDDLHQCLGDSPPLRCLAAIVPGAVIVPGQPVIQAVPGGDAGKGARDAGSALEAIDRVVRALLPCTRAAGEAMTQIYRRLDERGRVLGDVLRQMDDDPVAGQVLVRLIVRDGRWCAAEQVDVIAAEIFERHQRAAAAKWRGDVPQTDERGRRTISS